MDALSNTPAVKPYFTWPVPNLESVHEIVAEVSLRLLTAGPDVIRIAALAVDTDKVSVAAIAIKKA